MTKSTEIADKFAAILAEWLSPEDFAEMKRRNRTLAYAHGSCASHDFCDANMAMSDAFVAVLGRAPKVVDPGPEGTADCGLWNDAWEDARARRLI